MSSVLHRLSRIFRARLRSRLGDGEPRQQHAARSGAARSDAARPDADRPHAGAGQAPHSGVRADSVLARYYANLELPYGADLVAVRRAWKRLLRRYHPDLHGADPERQQVATELVQGLNRAFEGLRRHLERNE